MMIRRSQFNKIESFGTRSFGSTGLYLMTSTHILFLVLVHPTYHFNNHLLC